MNSGRLKEVGAYVTKSVTGLLTAVALLLVFFLLQSKVAGTEPAIAGHKIYIVMSGSMEPALKVGSIVVVKPLDPEEIRPGDIITFRSEHNSSVTTHRVNRVGADENGLLFYTIGDANEVEDPSPVEPRHLIGNVVLTVPYVGYLFAYARTPQGARTLFGLAVLVVAGELVYNFMTGKKQSRRAATEANAESPPESRL
ncbi:MAG TPA: signal peptidase I [Firmicutes bacterium]|nr:signal peptidase I [Bacillota bacterium]